MSYHQVRLRKDGPIHAVYFVEGSYATRTRCGMYVSPLDTPRRRLFKATNTSCKRCSAAAT